MKNNTDIILYNMWTKDEQLPSTADAMLAKLTKLKNSGFTGLHLAPPSLSGNGSPYAISDFFALDPQNFDGGDSMTQEQLKDRLRLFIRLAHKIGLFVLVDAVLWHCHDHSPLVENHPDWFFYNEDGKIVYQFVPTDPDHPYGDIVRFRYDANCPDSLWQFLADVLDFYYNDLGFDGCRLDMAAWCPAAMLKKVVAHSEGKLLIAESFGCGNAEFLKLRDCGIRYVYNSAFWAGFDTQSKWIIDQLNFFNSIGLKSVTILANHDTCRLLHRCGSAARVKQFIQLLSLMSGGVSVTSGDLTGALEKIDVCRVRNEPARYDLTQDLADALEVRRAHPALRSEAMYYDDHGDFFIVFKHCDTETVRILVNRLAYRNEAEVDGTKVDLAPFEVRLLAA
ncbi:MAG: hypothetical protein E7631_08210 [Ruminococcaceae bacterium]|nr:hypothetical protein [Oscillospiraceae bacterium]